MQHIEGLLNRYKMIRDRRNELRYIPEIYDKIEFIFTHPENMKLIPGTIENISSTGISFLPDSPHLTSDIDEETEIPYCSLRIDAHIMSLTCKVIRNDQLIAFHYMDINVNDRAILASVRCL